MEKLSGKSNDYQLETGSSVCLRKQMKNHQGNEIEIKTIIRELGMPEGLHCEGAALHSLLGLLLWDQIYQVSELHSATKLEK